MKNAGFSIFAVVVAALVGALASRLLAPSARAADDATERARLELALEEMASSLDTIRSEQKALEASLSTLSERGAAAPSGRVALGELDAAVARWMEDNVTAEVPSRAGVEDPALSLASADLGGVVDVILAGELSSQDEQAFWERLRDAGRLDDVVAELERLAELDPNDPDLQVELGDAYIQKIFEVGNSPLAGVYGQQADEAYDRALELDDTHWDARFDKAVALSNWPAFLGKSGEAIQQFEILVSQQETRSAQPGYAQTYFLLGNMYQQNGQADKAREAWSRGLNLFPDDTSLRQQLALAEQ